MRRAARRVLLLLAALLLLPGETEPASALETVMAARAKTKRVTRAKTKYKDRADQKTKGKKQKDKAAQDARVWTMTREGGNPTLQFGRGGTDMIVTFACLPDAGLVRVVTIGGTTTGRRALRPGDGARIRLMAGPVRFELAGTAFTSDAGSTLYVGSTTRLAPRFFALFKRGETMTVEVPNRTTGISLKGLGPRADAFERACLGGR